MFFTYVIEDQVSLNIYIGQTSDLQDRLDRHNGLSTNKNTSYTKKSGSDWQYIFVEGYLSRQEAVIREKQLKSYRGRQFIQQFRKH